MSSTGFFWKWCLQVWQDSTATVLLLTSEFLRRGEKPRLVAAGGVLLHPLWTGWWNLGQFGFIEITVGTLASFWGAHCWWSWWPEELLRVCCHWWCWCSPALSSLPTWTSPAAALPGHDPHPWGFRALRGAHLHYRHLCARSSCQPSQAGVCSTKIRQVSGVAMETLSTAGWPTRHRSPSRSRCQHQSPGEEFWGCRWWQAENTHLHPDPCLPEGQVCSLRASLGS